jgi:hypothetical protein
MRPMVGTSITGDTVSPPRRLMWATASSSFGTPTYIAQNGGAFIPSGRVIRPATGIAPLLLNVVYGCGDPANGAASQPTTFL